VEFRFRNTFQNITRANLRFGGDLPLLSLFEDELYTDSFGGFPGSDECQHRIWPLHVAHERPRVTQKFRINSGVIHQKLRLERAHHAGYLLAGVRGVIMYFLMDPDIYLYEYTDSYYTCTQSTSLRSSRLFIFPGFPVI
jgi:hypothetical protein